MLYGGDIDNSAHAKIAGLKSIASEKRLKKLLIWSRYTSTTGTKEQQVEEEIGIPLAETPTIKAYSA